MTLTLTDAAVMRIKEQLQQRGHGLGLRVGVKSSGCSSYAYIMNYADKISEDDSVFERDGVKVVVDAKSLPVLDGSELDFIREGLNRRFRVNNPRARDFCGCGDSFNLDQAP